MGAALAEASRAARDVFAEVDEALGQNLFRLMREGPDDELKLTENAQPAIMAHSLAVFRTLGRRLCPTWRVSSPATASANIRRLCAAGSFDLSTTAKLLKLRGQAMQRAVPVGEGAMAALLGADLALAQKIADAAAQGEVCTVANDNDPSQVVISGAQGRDRPRDRDGQGHGRQARGAVAGLRALPLPADAAGRRSDARRAQLCRRRAPAVPLFANVTAQPETRSRHDPQPAGRAGHRHGPLARKRRQHGRGRRRGVRRARRQGARSDGQAHRCPTPRSRA